MSIQYIHLFHIFLQNKVTALNYAKSETFHDNSADNFMNSIVSFCVISYSQKPVQMASLSYNPIREHETLDYKFMNMSLCLYVVALKKAGVVLALKKAGVVL